MKPDGKSGGYGFVEFENEKDMLAAYKHADGRKVNGRRIVVDVERGRTVKNWKPRRLAGGLGGTRNGSKDMNVRSSGRYVLLLRRCRAAWSPCVVGAQGCSILDS